MGCKKNIFLEIWSDIMKITKAEFVTSASKVNEIPESNLPEVAFIGRSNVGKSSLINMLVWKKWLAKSSNKPWKTQLLNFFNINDLVHFVDLPGYGYAKASRKDRIEWMDTMYEYFTQSENLKKVFVLVDANVSPQKIDIEFIWELVSEEIPYDIIFTKMDKTTQKNTSWNIKLFKQELKKNNIQLPMIFLTSTERKRWWDKVLESIEALV